MFGQITDLELVREIERRGLYTSALVTPPIEPIREVVVREPDIIFPSEEPAEFPEEPVIVYPRGPEEEPEEIPYIPIVTPPFVTVPAIEVPKKEPFVLTKTHIAAGAALLAIIFLFGGAPAAARAAAARLPPADRARARTVTEVF